MNDDQKRTLTVTVGAFFLLFSIYLLFSSLTKSRLAFPGAYIRDSDIRPLIQLFSVPGNILLSVFGLMLLIKKFSPAYWIGIIGSSSVIMSAFLQGVVQKNSLFIYVSFLIPLALLIFILTYYKKLVPLIEHEADTEANPFIDADAARAFLAKRYLIKMAVGLAIAVFGFLISVITYNYASKSMSGGTYTVAWGAMLFGVYDFFRGMIGWFKNRS